MINEKNFCPVYFSAQHILSKEEVIAESDSSRCLEFQRRTSSHPKTPIEDCFVKRVVIVIPPLLVVVVVVLMVLLLLLL